MLIKNFFKGSRKMIAYASMILIFIGMFSCFVISTYWFSNYTPYGAHGDILVKVIYYCLLLCFIFSLIGFLVLVLMFVSYFFIPKIAESSALSVTLVTFLTIFSILSIIASLLCGVIGSIEVNVNEYLNDEDKVKDFNGRCYPWLVSSIAIEMFEHAMETKDIKGFAKWIVKIARKISNDFKKAFDEIGNKKAEESFVKVMEKCIAIEDTDPHCFEDEMIEFFVQDNLEYNNSLCKDVGVPSCIFAIFTLVGLILFAVSCCCKGNAGDERSLSENEA